MSRTSNGNSSANDVNLAHALDLTETLEVIAHEAQKHMGTVAQSAFFVGDGLQRAVNDAIFDFFTPRTWQPGNLFRLSSSFIKTASAWSRLLSPQQANLVWMELKNKINVFTLVRNLDSRLGLNSDRFIPLSELVEKAYSLPAFEALWAVEGVGHYYADSYWKWHGEPCGLLLEENAQVPVKSMTMLHAGIGLCFADRLVGALTTESTAEEVRAALVRFVSLCKNNSREGYLGAAIESLGLVSRDFYPDLLKIVSEQFRMVAPELMGFFWHGAGRALYFSRQYFVPVLYSLWSGVELEETTGTERLSALAGRTWASTLVNMRQPEIMENVLRTLVRGSSVTEAFMNGVSSCMTMRWDTTPNEPFVIDFYNHQPAGGDANLIALWNRCVGTPAKAAVETYHPALSKHQALQEVFRYQDLARLADHLTNGPGLAKAS